MFGVFVVLVGQDVFAAGNVGSVRPAVVTSVCLNLFHEVVLVDRDDRFTATLADSRQSHQRSIERAVETCKSREPSAMPFPALADEHRVDSIGRAEHDPKSSL